MAELQHNTSAPIQQPDLRSYIVCDRLPEGCVAYPVTDEENLPHLRPGDIAIVDPTDRAPEKGELFVIEWIGGSSDIVETWLQPHRAGCGPNGEMIDTLCWKVGGSARSKTPAETAARLAAGRSVGWVNGPYATEGPRAGALNEKLRGKVVGILEPAFSEPKRLLAA